MRRRVIMGLLALGVVGGFGSGFAHLHCARQQHEQQVMHQWAQNCVDATHAAPANGQTVQVTPGSTVTIVVNPPAR